MKAIKDNPRRTKRQPPVRAAIEDLEKVHRTDFGMREPRPLPAGRKPRAPRRPLTVPADERVIMALGPDGTNQMRKIAGVPYLYVRVLPSGRRTFVAMKRMNAQRVANRMLGQVGRMTLREAVLGSKVALREWRIAELEARVAELEAELQEARSAADA